MRLSLILPLHRDMESKKWVFLPLKIELLWLWTQAISLVPPDRSYYDRPIRGVIKHTNLITLDILWAQLETQIYAQKHPKMGIFTLKNGLFWLLTPGYFPCAP